MSPTAPAARHRRCTDNSLTAAGSALLVASALHLYWLCGGRRGRNVVIPTRDGRPVMSPGPGATVAVAALLAAAGGSYIGAARRWRPVWLHRLATAGAGAVLAARAVGDGRTMGFTKVIKRTPFARLDTRVLSPLCTCLGAAGVIGALRR
jgi:hypothetical protein